ncbi:hypothetical protein EUTSA_v10014281mg [Eutrema salsugineum]|uniref:DUF4283 domain-containing protein n=1 Tax=Eutrema salsugineum TaxID=72664 RepID=V4KZW7_EUTSA|nr:hypothetical protein EUTSA_v10014281mg [Eutrema salsugineum]
MRDTLPRAWHLHDRVHVQLNDDGTIQFFFRSKHQLLSGIDRGPWSFKDWMVVMDPWTRRLYPNFLRTISFWFQVFSLSSEYRNQAVVEKIVRQMGQLEGLIIIEPTHDTPAEVWVRLKFDAYEPLSFVRYVQLEEVGPPVLLRFQYERLKKLCITCGRLTHEDLVCPWANQMNPILLPNSVEEQHQIDEQPHIEQKQVEQNQDLIEYDAPLEEVHAEEYMQDVQPSSTRFGQPGAVVEAGGSSGHNAGYKRKVKDTLQDESSPSHRQRILENNANEGSVVAVKPPQAP